VNQDEYIKENPQDFALWKAWVPEDGPVFWETDIGKGRPGWHLECSVMGMKLLGKNLDIHTGGEDLVFPHHENEIAQSEAVSGKHFVNYWVHTRFLLVDGEKMAKRLNNFYTLDDLKQFNPLAIRLELMSAHYRQQLNFTLKGIEEKQKTLQGLQEFIERLQEVNGEKNNPKVKKLISSAQKDFEKAMDSDLSIPEALRSMFELVTESNKLIAGKQLSKQNATDIQKFLMKINFVLGILSFDQKKAEIPREILSMIEERETARKNKDWKKADELRNSIQNKGYLITDSDTGARVKKAS
jgi:cysteinyl-tRNA synthetase